MNIHPSGSLNQTFHQAIEDLERRMEDLEARAVKAERALASALKTKLAPKKKGAKPAPEQQSEQQEQS